MTEHPASTKEELAILPILPTANAIKIGGQCLIDRGRVSVFPLREGLVAIPSHHKQITGAGLGAFVSSMATALASQ